MQPLSQLQTRKFMRNTTISVLFANALMLMLDPIGYAKAVKEALEIQERAVEKRKKDKNA